jgi:hypothetical protein
MKREPFQPSAGVCSSVLAVLAFLQKGRGIVPFNLFIELLEQREHWNSPHRRHRILYVQPASISFAPLVSRRKLKGERI